jgi:hypothetical protein
MARMIAANTTHGRYGAAGAAARTARRHVRTVVARIGLMCTATRLLPYLPDGAAASLTAYPVELLAPKHPSQVAFEAACAAKACTVRGGADGVGLAPRMRAAERAAAAAEVASQAPWRAAIGFARAAKRAARERARRERSNRASSLAIQSLPPGTGPGGEMAFRAAGLRARVPSCGQVWEPMQGMGLEAGLGRTVEGGIAERETDSLGATRSDALQREMGTGPGGEAGSPPTPRQLAPDVDLPLDDVTVAWTAEQAALLVQLAELFGLAAPQAASLESTEPEIVGTGPQRCLAP